MRPPSTYPTGSVESALIMEVIPLALDVRKAAADSLNARVLAVLEEMDARAARILGLETALNNAAEHAQTQEARIKTVEETCAAALESAKHWRERVHAESNAAHNAIMELLALFESPTLVDHPQWAAVAPALKSAAEHFRSTHGLPRAQ